MPKGWIKLHRQIINSDIYAMPPLYLRVFERLILEANHQDREIPFKYSGEKTIGKKLIRRGERQTSIRQICQWVGWYEYGSFKEPASKTIKVILDWLVENNMIEIYPRKSNREGTHYKVVNYRLYQGEDGEKVTVRKQSGNNEETMRKQSLPLNKNDKNDIRMIKNDKEDIYILQPDEVRFLSTLEKIPHYPADRKRDLEMYQTLAERYPELDLCEAIEQWRMYKLDKPLTEKSNPRSQINMAFKKYTQWGNCLKEGERSGKSGSGSADRDQRKTRDYSKYDHLWNRPANS